MNTISNRSQAGAVYPDLLPNETIYEYGGQLWIGNYYTQGHDAGIRLEPLTQSQLDYLARRNALPQISKQAEQTAETRNRPGDRAMNTQTIIVDNPTRSRRWGWAYSTKPTGEGPYSIELPEAPDHTGTIRQVQRAIDEDRNYKGLGGTLYASAWFYDGRRIVNRDEFIQTYLTPLYDQDTYQGAPAAPKSVKLVLAID